MALRSHSDAILSFIGLKAPSPLNLLTAFSASDKSLGLLALTKFFAKLDSFIGALFFILFIRSLLLIASLTASNF